MLLIDNNLNVYLGSHFSISFPFSIAPSSLTKRAFLLLPVVVTCLSYTSQDHGVRKIRIHITALGVGLKTYKMPFDTKLTRALGIRGSYLHCYARIENDS